MKPLQWSAKIIETDPPKFNVEGNPMHLPTDYQPKVYAYASANGLNAVSHRTINERNYPNTRAKP